MSTFVDVVRSGKAPLWWLGGAFLSALFLAALSISALHRSESGAVRALARREIAQNPEFAAGGSSSPTLKAKPAEGQTADSVLLSVAALSSPDATVGRKIIRTSSLQIVVQHPSQTAERISALAQSLGGYVVNGEAGGDNANAATITIRVPAARFEQARQEIRKLGLRVENEKIESEDVTQRYVDQDATLRNLHAEEAQYLTILKQAKTVKDMLAVSEKLSEVRGQIEQQQAEFNALSQQIDTVSMTIALRTEAEAQTFGLSWRPGYEIRVALHDGLESLASYSTAMLAILFYLPAIVLWTGTILIAILAGWKTIRWAGRRWFGWTPERV